MEQFGLEVDQTGLVLSYVGCISLFMQGFGIPLLTSRLEDKSLIRLSTISLTISYAVLVSYFLDIFGLVFSTKKKISCMSTTSKKNLNKSKTSFRYL